MERPTPTLRPHNAALLRVGTEDTVTVHPDVRPIPEGSNDIRCFQCGGTVQQSRLPAHLRSRHPGLVLSDQLMAELALTRCPQCHQLFSTSRGLAAHLRTCRRGAVDESMIFLTPDGPVPEYSQNNHVDPLATQLIQHQEGFSTETFLGAHADGHPARSSPEVPLADLHQDGCDREVAEERRQVPEQEPQTGLPVPDQSGPAQEGCMNCEQPAIPWPCCGGAIVCVACTRQTRNSVPTECFHLPNPRCPVCRADYPRTFEFALYFCRVCTQTTEVLPDFETRELTDRAPRITHRAPSVREVDDQYIAVTCCGGRVHLACLGSLSERGACPLCVEDHCAECHLACDPQLCRPRQRTEAANQDTKYDRCQNPPLQRRVCGHTACSRHAEQELCRACMDGPAPPPESRRSSTVPDDLIGLPHSPVRSEGENPGPFEYGSEELSACPCGGTRNLFECDVCGPLPFPEGVVDIHLTDLFEALHNNRALFVDSLMGQSSGALNAVSRISSICPSCGSAVSKTNPGSPACDAMLCTMCQTHFCFYCESRVADNYNLPGHGPHYGNHTFDRRPAGVRNGWCLRRQREPALNTVRPPRVVTVQDSTGGPGRPVSSGNAGLPHTDAPLPCVADADTNVPHVPIAAATADPVQITSSSLTVALSFVPPVLPAVRRAPTPHTSRTPATPTLPSGTPSSRQRSRTSTANAGRRTVAPSSRPTTGVMAPLLPRPQAAPRSGPPRRAKVLPYVPKNLWTLFQDVCRPIFADLERASVCNNMVEIEHLLKELLEVPAHTLSVRRGGRRLESSLASQLRAATITRVQPPSHVSARGPTTVLDRPHEDIKTDQSGREVKVNDADPRAVRRAVGLTLTNHASRATRAIYQEVLPEVSQAIEEQLLELHPPATGTAIPALPPNAPFAPVLGDEKFVRLWKKRVANGAAPAVSGFTGDHGLPLLEDSHCLRGLALLVQLIRNGQLSDQCRVHLLSCPVIPTLKRTGGIRPVTIGETFYKMAAIIALNDVEEDAVELLGPDQFALRPGGPESATIALKVALETRTGASTDIKNAFNSLDRGLMMRELFAHPALAPVWRLAHWVYSQPVELQLFSSDGVFRRFITAACGPLQGEPFSSFLYCLATKPLIDAAKAAGGPGVDVIALTDDVTFIGPPDEVSVTKAVKAYEIGAARLNLRFQARKSTFISFHGQPLSDELLQYATTQGMQVEKGCCIIGGTPMGPDRERVQHEALQIARKSQRFFSALQHEAMTAPVADRLLRLCGVPRVQFLARVGLFGEYEDALSYFDEQVQHAATLQAGLDEDEGSSQVSSQQAAPLRHAGFAFRAYADNISLFAAVGAFAGAAVVLHRLCPDGLPQRIAISVIRTIHAVRERIDDRTAARCLPPSTSSADQCLHFYAVTEQGKQAAFRLQKTLSMAAAEKVTATLLQASSPVDAARFFACAAPYASAWLSDPFLARPMTDEAHGAACKLRLNQPISSLTTCLCGHDLQNDPWHILSHKGGGEAGRRHDEIVDRLVDAVHRAGGQAWAEPRQDFWQDRRRTDIFAVMGPKSYHIDVRVTHPTSVSYVTTACQGSLQAAEEAAQEKKRRYAAMAHSEGATFVPFIVETYGGFGKDARAFIADLAKFAATTSRVWSAAETRFMVRAEVQRALFEGNLRVANAVLQESNPIRYASGRYHAVAPRPRLSALDMASDADNEFTQATTPEAPMLCVPTATPSPVSMVVTPTTPVTVFQPRTPPRRQRSRSPLQPSTTHVATNMGTPHPPPPDGPPPTAIDAPVSQRQGVVPPGTSHLPSRLTTLSSGRQLFTHLRPLFQRNSREVARSTPRRPRQARAGRLRRRPVLVRPLLLIPTPFQESPPSATSQHPPQPPHPPPIPLSQSLPQSQQTQSPTTSLQTSTNTNRQSSHTLASTSSSLNGTQTQISSRTEEKVAPGSSSSRNASRDEALSLLDRIRPTIRSQTNGTITPNRSRSERGNWRSDGRRTPTTSSREVDRRRGRGAGRGNSNATQVHTTTQPGTSRYR